MSMELTETAEMPSDEAALRRRLRCVRELVAAAAQRAGRSPQDVTLVGVSKTVDRQMVDVAYRAGLRHFGENRVQEAVAKFAAPLPADASLHLIGQLQTNKAKPAARLFSYVESVDRAGLIDALARAAAAEERDLPVLLQVNVAGESQKAGCAPADAPALVRQLRAAGGLRLLGLMTIAPLVDDLEAARPVFRALRSLRDGLCEQVPDVQLPILSMGMSNDFAVAIEEGATHVRIGRAIFGVRH